MSDPAPFFNEPLNHKLALLLSLLASQRPNQFLLPPEDSHEGRRVDAIDALLSHEHSLLPVYCLQTEAVAQEKVVPLPVEKPF